jgi:DNA polymerase-3 subunit alpha
MNNYTIYHLHSDFSLLDSATKYDDYIYKAKESGMLSIGFSEHSSVFNWIKKKQKCDENEIKYIHGQEFYITLSLEERVRDNWHCILIAKNLDGIKELNRLSSIGYNRDGHYYYDPRISLQELITTSNNIIVTSACLGGILNSGNENVEKVFLDFMIDNKDRCFLEVQHHNNEEQFAYNKKLLDLSNHYGLRLIAGTDTHSLDKKHEKLRTILQKSKNINFPNEESWDLVFKTYDELVESYAVQNSLPKNVYMEAIENTNVMADMVEHFDLSLEYKYPKIYENSDEIFKEKVYEGLKNKGLGDNKDYIKRIEYETKAIAKNGAIDYLLLQEKITSWCRNNDIMPGYSRGSVSGCLCAYLLGITDIDSLKFNMNFERFMNAERVSLSDIDIDYPPDKREQVKEYIFNNLGLNCCDIVAFNTVAEKGSIRDVGRALEIPLSEINEISKNVGSWGGEEDKRKYPELFELSGQLEGVITSSGVHPCGVVTSTLDLEEELGTFTTSTDIRRISQVDMKGIDSVNFVKLDILGLDNIQIINDTCRLAGIERLNPDNVNFEDEKVWDDIMGNSIGVFQWESDFAHQTYKKLFSKETLKKIEEKTGKIDRLALLSMANGAIRPAGESYRDAMCEGEFKDNGHEALNEMLKSTMGYLVYQEDILRFLHEFCGYSMGKADVVRRGFAKKVGTEKFIPHIKSGFIKTMKEKYGTPEEESEEIVESFLTVIEDASLYLFSLNHSYPYSMIGYVCAYLRYYYKLEFVTTMLNINKDNIEKSATIIDYAKENKILIKSPKFRFSRSSYFFDRETNSIYKDLSSIKYLNSECGEQLYEAGKLKFESFVDLLVYIEENLKVNSRQLETLIKIKFFDEFGGNKKLLDVYKEFSSGKNKYTNKLKEETKAKRLEHIKEFEKETPNEFMNVLDQIYFEQDSLGYIQATYDGIDKRLIFVGSLDTKYAPRIEAYCLANGKISSLKLYRKTYDSNPFGGGEILFCKSFEKKRPIKFVDGKYVEDANGEFQWWLTNYDIISPEKFNKILKGEK